MKYLFKCRCRLFDCELSSASLFRHGVYDSAGGAVVPQSAVDLLSAEALAADNNRRVQAVLCLASYISAAGLGQALLGCQSTTICCVITICCCETQDLHLGTSIRCVVLILTDNLLCPVCLLFSRGYIHNIATKFEENDMKNKVCGR